MAVDCDADEIMAREKRLVAHCNPQEDSLHHQKFTKTVAPKTRPSDMPIPYPFTVDDSSPWSALERLKKEANRVAMHSFPEDEHETVVAMRNEITEKIPSISTASHSREDITSDAESGWDQEFVSQAFEFVDKNNQTPKSDNLKTARAFDADPSLTGEVNTSFPTFSECNSFSKASSGYLYPIKGWAQLVPTATVSVSSTSKHDDEGMEHTVENFNQFLELSSMTTDSFDHAIFMRNNGTRSSEDGEVPTESMDAEEVATLSKEDRRKGTVHKGLWPERLLKTPDMADAPSGILLVFDRMLDCIDPGGTRPIVPAPKDDEYGYDTDNSSTWSLSVNRSWLLKEFDIGETDLSTTGSCSSSGDSLFGRFKERESPSGAEWLDQSLDYIFPCWKEPPSIDDTSILELTHAVEVNRKRKWDCEDHPEAPGANGVTLELEIEEEDDDECEARRHESGKSCDGGAGAVAEQVCTNDFGDNPFDFPPPEFPPPVWNKKPDASVVETGANDDDASGSSLSELFEGLVFGTPSDEKEEGDDDELQQILDRTSATEETSTLGYSDGSI